MLSMRSVLGSETLHRAYAIALISMLASALFIGLPAAVHAQAPEISSPTFTEPGQWYPPVAGQFTWTLTEGVERVAVEVGTSTQFEPMNVLDGTPRTYTVPANAWSSGTQYVGVQFRVNGEWGDIAYYPVRIDTEPPEMLSVNMAQDKDTGELHLMPRSVDAESGVAGFAVAVNGKEYQNISPDAAEEGMTLDWLKPGVHEVTVAAFDEAGNQRTRTFPIVITPGVAAGAHTAATQSTEGAWLHNPALIPALVGLLVISVIFAFLVYIRHRQRTLKLRTEMFEVYEQMERIFMALRDEIHDQVQQISSKKRLSKGEQEAVTNLNKILDVSKTLVDKEMTDVKKLFKDIE